MVLPSRRTTKVKAIDTFEGERESAFAPMSVTLRLEDEVDVSRGEMLVHPNNLPTVAQRFEAHVVWMSEKPLDREKSYFLKHTTRLVRAEVESVLGHVDLETLEEVPSDKLELNDIARAVVRTHRPIFFDAYAKSRNTGAFILIDSLTNDTVAAGMIVAAERDAVTRRGAGPRSQVSAAERRERLGQAGAVVWVSGKGGDSVELAYAIERRLFDLGRVALVLALGEAGSGEGAVSGQLRAEPAVEIARRAAAAGLIVVVAAPDVGAAEAAAWAARGGELRRELQSAFVDVEFSGGGEENAHAQAEAAVGAPVVVRAGDDVELAATRVSRALETRKMFV
jgi:hypothetical protein